MTANSGRFDARMREDVARVLAEPKIDCHCHVLDPLRFPYGDATPYRPAGQEIGTAEQYAQVRVAYGIERALLVGPMFFVLAIELVNSAVEATVDRIGIERHPLSAIAKELGSAAVFVAFVLLGLNWLLVLGWRR